MNPDPPTPHPPTGREPEKSPFRRMAGLVSGFAMLPLFVVAFASAPACMGFGQPAIDVVQQCPTAMQALGAPVGMTWMGLSYGNAETEDDDGQASWTFPIAGSRARGTLDIHGVERGGRWRFNQLTLTTGEQTIDVIACAAGGTGAPVTITHQAIEGSVTTVVGHPSLASGAACAITIDPSSGGDNCRLNVSCAGTTLYGGGTQGYGHCGADAGGALTMRDGNPTSVDGDPMIDLSIARHEIVITDQDAQGTWVVTITTR